MNSARLAIFFKTLYIVVSNQNVLLLRGAEQNVNTATAPKYVHQPYIISWGSNSSIFQINFNQQQSTLISCMMLMLSTNICNWEIEASYVAHLSFMSILQSIPESKFQINSNWIHFCWCEQGQHIVVNFPYGEIVLKVSFAETRLPAFVWKFQCWPFPAKVNEREQKLTEREIEVNLNWNWIA